MTRELTGIRQMTRVEGHGDVVVSMADDGTAEVGFHVTEAPRLFEAMVRGHSYEDVATIASRICGICSPSHCVTSLEATEKVFGVEVSERTRLLRSLLIMSSFLQNHATHLFLFVAPDHLGIGSSLALAQSDPELLAKALRIKAAGNELSGLVGGRAVHPMTPVVGGFTSEPTPSELLAFAERLDALVPLCEEMVDLVGTFPVPEHTTAGDFLAIHERGTYAFAGGSVSSLLVPREFPVDDHRSYIVEETADDTNARLSHLDDGRTFMVGALARLNHSWGDLTSHARISAAKVGLRPVCLNPFMNNLSQAIELVHVAGRCAELCRRLAEDDGDSTPVAFEVRAGEATAATEAPRGTLYHHLAYDDEGRVTAADIVTPTAQNLANLAADLQVIAPHLALDGEEALRRGTEQLVRAYDPCLSCAVH